MTPPTCPVCGKPRQDKYRPFCSARCGDVDLHRWLNRGYAIASTGSEEEDSVTTFDDGEA